MSEPPTATLDLTTSPGLEDLVLDELRVVVPTATAELRPDGLAGHVRIAADLDPDALWVHARRLRSALRVVRPLARFALDPVDPLGQVRRELARLAPTIRELEPIDARFRVRCKRVGEHRFTSEDVEREGGAGVRDAMVRGVRLKGDAVVVRCDVRDQVCLVGIQAPDPPTEARPWRPTTSLRPNLAWALLELARPAGTEPPRSLLDPFAGGGTVVLEAAARWPDLRLHASDLHARCADGVRQNLEQAGALGRAVVRVGDARHLDGVWPDVRFDTIATNPPFGERLGQALDLEAFYRAFLQSAATVATDDARLVVLVLRRGAFNRALRAAGGWETRHVRIVELGGLYAGVFVLARSH